MCIDFEISFIFIFQALTMKVDQKNFTALFYQGGRVVAWVSTFAILCNALSLAWTDNQASRVVWNDKVSFFRLPELGKGSSCWANFGVVEMPIPIFPKAVYWSTFDVLVCFIRELANELNMLIFVRGVTSVLNKYASSLDTPTNLSILKIEELTFQMSQERKLCC